jgi:hypothetical protein
MALQTYSDLTGAVADWLGRSDLSGRIPDFVTLFEAAANRRLRVRQMEVTTTLTPGANGQAALPADYLAWRRATWTGSPRRELDYVHPSILQSRYPDQPVATPRVFTIEGANLEVMPLDQTPLEFDYFQRIGPLVSAQNWLMAAHPDIYLFGALAEAHGFNIDLDKLAVWKARRDEIFDEIEKLSNKTRGAGRIQVMGHTP